MAGQMEPQRILRIAVEDRILSQQAVLPLPAAAQIFEPSVEQNPHVSPYHAPMGQVFEPPVQQNPHVPPYQSPMGQVFEPPAQQNLHVPLYQVPMCCIFQPHSQSVPNPVYQFTYKCLEVGQQFEAVVSSIIDGPLCFAVQLTSEMSRLTNMMNQIQAMPVDRITGNIGPGDVCLVRYRRNRNLYRAEVSNVGNENIAAYFVDFGCNEVVPFVDIYEIPVRFMEEKALAYRVSLANIGTSDMNQDVRTRFKTIVKHRRPVIVKALAEHDDDTYKQVADLYVKQGRDLRTNIRLLLPLQRLAYNAAPEPTRNAVKEVVVSYVESPRKFFVRYMAHNRHFQTLSANLERYCDQAGMEALLTLRDLDEDMPVCALYDNYWYRAVITGMPDHPFAVPVFYVDYGNEESVSLETLLKIREDFVEGIRPQAVQCILSGLETFEEDVYCDVFIDLALENEFNMEIIDVLPNKVLVVDLKDKSTGASIKDKFIEKITERPVRTVQNAANSDAEREQNVVWNKDSKTVTRTLQKQASQFAPPLPQPSGSREEAPSTSAQSEESRRRQNWKGENHNSRISGTRYNADSFSRRSGETQPREWRKRGSRGREDTDPRSSWRNESFSGRQYRDRRPREYRGDFKRSDFQREDRFRRDGKFGKSNGKEDGNEESWDDVVSRQCGTNNAASKTHNLVAKYEQRRGFGHAGSKWWKSGERRFDSSEFQSGNKPFEDRTFGRRERGVTKNREERLFGRKPFAPQLLHGFPKGAQLDDYNVTIGSSLKCCVTWFMSPDCFYIQVSDPEFRELMQSIQEEYKNRKPLDNIEVGDTVIARCSEDQVLYRARVTEVTYNSVNVYFVDYGNFDTCKKEHVWTISEDHCSLPAQAIRCRLNGIEPLEQKPWSSLVAVIDDYFNGNKYVATAIGKEEDTSGGTTWKVNMVDEKKEDICAKIVKDGNAQRECTQLALEPPADLPMLKNQTIAVYVAWVESSEKFFVHLEPNKVRALRDTINTMVKTFKMEQMPSEDLTEDAICLVRYKSLDGTEWKRARVINANTRSATVNIQYIDCGDEDIVSFKEVYVVPDKLLTYSVQATECSLFNPDGEKLSDETEEQFEMKTYEKHLIAHVNCVTTDYKLIVTLYDVDGVHLGFPKVRNDVICSLPSMPLLRQQDVVKITQLTVKNQELVVYMQRISDQNEVNEIENKRSVLSAINSEPPTNLEPGAICIVKTDYREGWCQGKVINKKDNTYNIYCVDFGYTIDVNLQDVRLLGKECYCVGETCTQEHTDEEKMGYWPVELCAEVYTDIVCSGEPESEALQEKLDKLYLSIEEDTFKVELCKTSRCLWKGSFVSIKTNRTLEKYCEEHELGTKNEQEPKYNPLEKWLKDDYTHVAISHYESPSSFWVLLREDLVKVENLQKNLHSALKYFPTIKNFEGFFANKYPLDGKWYRSEVNRTDAVSIDFGYATEPKNIKVMPYMLQNVPKYAIKCSLGITANDAANDFFKNLVKRDVLGKINVVDADAHFITLQVEGQDVRNILLKDSNLQSYDVSISHAVSLEKFWVQKLDNTDTLYKIKASLAHADEWEQVSPKNEDIVAAKFSEDELWYRGIVSITENSPTVYFVDYGNTSVCTEFRHLPQNLATIPFLAQECTLISSIRETHDPSKINDAFLSLATKFGDIFSVKFTDYAVTPMPVTMMYKNKEILSFLNAVKREIPPAKIRVGSPVNISYIESPVSFYIQDVKADAVVKINKILENDDPNEKCGTFCNK